MAWTQYERDLTTGELGRIYGFTPYVNDQQSDNWSSIQNAFRTQAEEQNQAHTATQNNDNILIIAGALVLGIVLLRKVL